MLKGKQPLRTRDCRIKQIPRVQPGASVLIAGKCQYPAVVRGRLYIQEGRKVTIFLSQQYQRNSSIICDLQPSRTSILQVPFTIFVTTRTTTDHITSGQRSITQLQLVRWISQPRSEAFRTLVGNTYIRGTSSPSIFPFFSIYFVSFVLQPIVEYIQTLYALLYTSIKQCSICTIILKKIHRLC